MQRDFKENSEHQPKHHRGPIQLPGLSTRKVIPKKVTDTSVCLD